MWKKIAMGGAVAAAIVGAGTASVALTGSDTVAGTAANPSAASAPGNGEGAGQLQRHLGRHPLARLGGVLHGQWVTKNKDGELVTHNEIHGTVTAVSSTSITVKASDGVTQTYAVTSDTKVHQHTKGDRRGEASEIGKVKTGDNVVVFGTGTDTLTANRILDILEK